MTTIIPEARPTSRYGPPPQLGIHPEAGGFVATCRCQHIHWSADQKTAATEYAKHVKGCKSHRVEVAA